MIILVAVWLFLNAGYFLLAVLHDYAEPGYSNKTPALVLGLLHMAGAVLLIWGKL